MADNERKQINEDRDANVNIDSVVVTSENGKRKPIDFIDYIETSSNENAIKIRALRKYISDKELLKIYQKEADGIEKESKVEERLEKIATQVALHINNIQNGIVVNLETLTIDEKASFEKAIKNNIYSEDSIVENLDKTVLDILNESKLFNDKSENEVVNYILENFNQEYINYKEFDDDINNFLNKDEKDMNLSEAAKNISRKNKDIIVNSPYETNIELFEISKLEVLYRTTKNSIERERIADQINEFHKKHPEYVGKKLLVLNPDGTLNENEVAKMAEYREAYEKTIILEHFNQFNGMSEQEIALLDGRERSHMIMCAFSALRYENDGREDERELAKDAKRMIKQLEPGLDLNNGKELAKLLEKLDGRAMNVGSLDLNQIIEIYSRRLRGATENYIEKNEDKFVDGKFMSNMDLDYAERNVFDSAMKNYFIGSKIKFTEEDENLYNTIHQEVTIHSWIESKEDAIKLRYTALLAMKEKYEKEGTDEYSKEKLKKIDADIEKFEKEFEKELGKVDTTLKEGEFSFEIYRQYFVDAGMTKYLTRDVMEWQDGANYADMDNEHKKGYIRNLLVALENKENPDFCITKLALRRLELMNSNEKQFITFDNNGGFEINEELILQEYNKMSEHTYESFNELKKSAEMRKNEYLLSKLEEYTHLRDKDFVRLDDKNDKTKSMQQIEEARYISNQKSIREMVQEGRIKRDKHIIENSPYETDMHLFEISKLQIMLKNPQNVENTQMYNITLSKIKEFYNKYPEYVGKEIPVLNSDGTLNENEIEKMNKYSEAYQRIIILNKLDMAKGYGVTKLSQSERNDVLICAFAGLKYEKSQDGEIRQISKESREVIKQLYPELNLNNEKELAKFFTNEMGFAGKIDTISLDEIGKINSLRLKEATEDFIEKDEESYIDKKIDFSSLNFDSSKRKIYSSVMKNYFVGSRMKFTEKDERSYNELYQHATVESWLENKENAIKLRYAALTTIRDEYKNNPVGTYTEKKLVDIENAIKEFEDKYGKIDVTEKEGEVSFKEYREDFINAGLTKYLTRDASDWSDGINYSELSDEHKKGYIRNILVALENKDKPNYITKVALRRLELMNSEGKEFVKFNEKGEYKIDEKLILEEYQSMSDYTYSSFKELTQSSRLRKNEYLLKKLEEYAGLENRDFLELSSKQDYKKSMEEIEKARYISNQKRIHEMVNAPEVPESLETSKSQKANNKKIDSKEMKNGFKSGKLEVVDLNVASQTKENTVRKPKINDQANLDDSTNANSELKENLIEASQIDDSAINNLEEEKDNKNPNIIEKIKNAVSTMKNFISKHISGKEKVKLLESGETDKKAEEVKKAEEKSDFNALISADIPLQDQQDFSKKMQMKNSIAEEKSNSEQEERM